MDKFEKKTIKGPDKKLFGVKSDPFLIPCFGHGFWVLYGTIRLR